MRGAFVKRQRASIIVNANARHANRGSFGAERNPRASRGGKDASPVGIPARERGLHERRCRDGARDLSRGGIVGSAADFNFDYARGTFSIGDNGEREFSANFFERGDLNEL